MNLTHGSLFTGIGGIDLGFERAGIHTRWQVERDANCLQVLERHWPMTERYEDVTTIDPYMLDEVDIISGGFPCQDISSAHTATERKYLDGDKSGLWSHFERVVAAARPRWVVVENVASNWRRWVPDVRAALAGHGYASVPLELSAAEVGAPHPRRRIFIVANADGDGEPARALNAKARELSKVPGSDWHGRPTIPEHLRVDDGVSDGMDTTRLRMLGNSVVPQVAQVIGEMLVSVDGGGVA